MAKEKKVFSRGLVLGATKKKILSKRRTVQRLEEERLE